MHGAVELTNGRVHRNSPTHNTDGHIEVILGLGNINPGFAPPDNFSTSLPL
jgi:hypothetical protein